MFKLKGQPYVLGFSLRKDRSGHYFWCYLNCCRFWRLYAHSYSNAVCWIKIHDFREYTKEQKGLLFHLFNIYFEVNSIYLQLIRMFGLPWWLSGKESSCQCSRCWFSPWVGKLPWRRKWHLTPVFLLGNPMDRGAWQAAVLGSQRVAHNWLNNNKNECLIESVLVLYIWFI